jgi:hypothetical protein
MSGSRGFVTAGACALGLAAVCRWCRPSEAGCFFGYATVDIDLVSASESLDEILPGWGFEHRGRPWVRADLSLIVEASGSRLAPGQRDRLTQVEVAGTSAYVLGLEDVIVGRLSACVHWLSKNDCRWAAVLLGAHRAELDIEYLREQAREAEVTARLEQMLEETV